ncbi:MAG TPA: long-chain fatty acid--CoA ligase [Mycobacteriales bacterium]|nr:long-chain fatty acid--CoA ligase [Mycobacteriales bacterium]
MHEFSVATTLTVAAGASLADMVFDNAAARPDNVAFGRRSADGVWRDVTAAEFAAEVRSVAGGLLAADVRAGDRIAIMSKTRYEWTLLDYAIWSVGGVPVPVYETSSAEQIQWILSDSGCTAAVLETAEHNDLLASVRDDLPELRTVWTIDDGGVELLAKGGAGANPAELDRRRADVRAADLATIIYTSGTTGRPKGCELTHENLLFEVLSTTSSLPSLFHEDAATLLFLPIAHVLGRVIQCAIVYAGIRLGHTSDIKNLTADLQEFRPTFLLAVPRVFEKVYNTAKQRAHADGKGRIFDLAERIAIRYSQAQEPGQKASLPLRLQHGIFDRLVYSKLRAALGGQCSGAISGGAPLGERLGHFFRGLGLFVYEGYGLTETTAACCLNLDNATRIGTVGRPIPGVSVRIAEDGEILVSGRVVFSRYWHNDADTAAALTDGWFHTGDIGDLDEEGFLRITGRKKELIVTAGGKNVSPAVLEDRLRAHPLISQCMVVGDKQPFIAALITLDPEALPAWCQAHDLPADSSAQTLRDNPVVREEVGKAVESANKAVSRAESIKKFRILSADFTEQGGELTPSLKLKRSIVMDRYADEVAELYG